MLGSATLDTGIGLILVFILFSTICAAIREGIESFLKTRASYLERGIRELLRGDQEGSPVLSDDFFKHPLIFSLFTGDYHPTKKTGNPGVFSRGKNLPSYIPSRNFALALMDMAARGVTKEDESIDVSRIISLDAIRTGLSDIKNTQVQKVLLTAIDTSQGDLNKVQANLEAWYNSGMDRVAGWYKRSTQLIIFVVALLAAVTLNVNTIHIADYLLRNDTARALIVQQAGNLQKGAEFTELNYRKAKSNLDQIGLPIGWNTGLEFVSKKELMKSAGLWQYLFSPFIGWFITALAATLGAPFWFDLLNKIMVIRSTVKPHEKSSEESSEDRQAGAASG
jgi:hypothetical protein